VVLVDHRCHLYGTKGSMTQHHLPAPDSWSTAKERRTALVRLRYGIAGRMVCHFAARSHWNIGGPVLGHDDARRFLGLLMPCYAYRLPEKFDGNGPWQRPRRSAL